MAVQQTEEIAMWRRWLAFWWYIWAQSCCYWGIHIGEPAFFRTGVTLYGCALGVWPSYTPALYRRGLIRGRELSQYSEALVDLSRVIDLDPEWPEPYLQRGLFQCFHGDPQAAIADLQQYLALGGDTYWRLEAQRQIAILHEELDMRDVKDNEPHSHTTTP